MSLPRPPTDPAEIQKLALAAEDRAVSLANRVLSALGAPILDYLDHFAFWRIVGWLCKRHPKLNWGTVHRRFLPGWEVRDGQVEMFRPNKVAVTRYRYRGTRIPTPWTSQATEPSAPTA